MTVTYNLISDLPVFLAYSLELEKEAAERLSQFSSIMEKNKQPDLAETFKRLAKFSEDHANEVANICKKRSIPLSPASNFDAAEQESPETFQYDDAGFSMTTREAVETMLTQEKASADFYAEVANRTVNPEIREFALTFAREEREHAEALEDWLNE